MKKPYYSLFLFISLALIFGYIVFSNNVPPFSLLEKSYINKFKQLRKEFLQEITQIEKNIYEDFLSHPHNLSLIKNIIKGSVKPDSDISFTKNKRLLNFIVMDDQQKILYQIKKQNNLLIKNFDFNKKNIINENISIFQIPFEEMDAKVTLLFELDTSSFLEKTLTHLNEYREISTLRFPKLLILETDKQSRRLNPTKLNKIIKDELKKCQTIKRICNVYIPNLQNRLLIDRGDFFNFSIGFLYPSNLFDIPSLSIVIFIILFFFIIFSIYIILVKPQKKKPISTMAALPNPTNTYQWMKEIDFNIDDYQNQKNDLIHEEIDLSHKIDQNKNLNLTPQKIVEVEIEVDPDKIPDFKEEDIPSEKEDSDEIIPVINDETYLQATHNSNNKEITELHQEINRNIGNGKDTLVSNEVDDNKNHHDLIDIPETIDKTIPQISNNLDGKKWDNTLNKEDQDEKNKNNEIQETISPSQIKNKYHDFSFDIVKSFFPQLKINEAENLLKEFPHANSLLLLKLENNVYKCEKGLFSDRETINQCKIAEDSHIITQYLKYKKGILIQNNKKNLSLIKPWLSKKDLEKTDLVFIFPLNHKNQDYIFILY